LIHYPIPQAGHGSQCVVVEFVSPDRLSFTCSLFFLISCFSQEVAAAETVATETPMVMACNKDVDSFIASIFSKGKPLTEKGQIYYLKCIFL